MTTTIETIREFAAYDIEPMIEKIELSGTVPDTLIEKAADLGLFGLSIPQEYGGQQLSLTDKCRWEEVLGGAHFGFATVLGNHNGVGTAGLVELGTDKQKATYLPAMARGDLRGAFCLTEPEAGSDAGAVQTTAVRRSGGYVIDGSKTLITQATVAGLFTVTARTESGLSTFIVERENPGLRVDEPTPILGMRGSTVAPVHFQDCFVPESALLGAEGKGLKQALNSLNRGRTSMTARVFGLGLRALEDATNYANHRHQFGRALIDNQGLAWRLADLKTQMEAGRHLLYAAARSIDALDYRNEDVAMAKYFVTETVGKVTDQVVQIFGGLGYTTLAPAERYLRDARVTRIYEGSTEIQLEIIARTLRKP